MGSALGKCRGEPVCGLPLIGPPTKPPAQGDKDSGWPVDPARSGVGVADTDVCSAIVIRTRLRLFGLRAFGRPSCAPCRLTGTVPKGPRSARRARPTAPARRAEQHASDEAPRWWT